MKSNSKQRAGRGELRGAIPLDLAKRRQSQAASIERSKLPIGGNDLDTRLSHLPLTDLGNAERFVARNRGRFMYCSTLGWLVWDGRRWAVGGAEEQVLQGTHQSVRAIQDEARAIQGTRQDIEVDHRRDGTPVMLSDKLAAWGRTSEAAPRLLATAKQAAPYLRVEFERLDADPMRINVLNGTLTIMPRPDAPYVTFHPHEPTNHITKLAPVIYDPNASSPIFDAFLMRVQPDAGMRRFLYQWSGLALTGDTSEQKLVFHYGTGRNGKSVYVEATGHVAGDYAFTIPIETFVDTGRSRRGGEATPDLAMLPGVRMLRTSEPEKGAKLAEGLIKLATGGEPISARHLNKPFFTFKPSFKLTIQGNERPKIDGTDEGIWGRLLLVPWAEFIPKIERDKTLGKKLEGEASGILNRMLSGLCDWLDNGLVVPPEVNAATEAYRADSDPIGRFLETCTRRVPDKRVQSTALHELYSAWARVNGEAPRSHKAFSSALKGRGMSDLKSGVQWWLHLETTARCQDFVDLHGEPLRAEDRYRRYRDGD